MLFLKCKGESENFENVTTAAQSMCKVDQMATKSQRNGITTACNKNLQIGPEGTASSQGCIWRYQGTD